MATENKEKAKGEAIFPLTQEQINQIAAIGAKEGVRAYKEEQKKEERRRKKEDSKVRKTKKLLSSYRRIKATLSDGEQFTPEEQAELRWKFVEDLMGNTREIAGKSERTMSKALLFRTKSRKNNPEGRSILRNAYRSWYFKRRIQEIEGIGIERDLAGLPVMHGPEGLDLWNDDIEDNKQTRIALENMVKSIRRDEMEGVVLPAGYELELLSSGGTRQFDTNAIINRYDTRIAMTVLADFIFLGHSETGSWALSSDKTELFAMAIGAFLDMICETFNSQGIPPLIDINGEHFAGITEYPKMSHGDIADVDVTKVAAFIKDMTGIGILVPDDGLEDYIRQVGHLPERTTDDRTVDQRRKQQAEQNQPPEPETAVGSDGNDEGEEIPDNVAEAAKRRLGRSGTNGNKVHTAKANTQGKDTGQSRSPTQT